MYFVTHKDFHKNVRITVNIPSESFFYLAKEYKIEINIVSSEEFLASYLPEQLKEEYIEALQVKGGKKTKFQVLRKVIEAYICVENNIDEINNNLDKWIDKLKDDGDTKDIIKYIKNQGIMRHTQELKVIQEMK